MPYLKKFLKNAIFVVNVVNSSNNNNNNNNNMYIIEYFIRI